jgi:hypothetical protein
MYVRSEVATAAKKQCACPQFYQIDAEGVMDTVCAANVHACFHVPLTMPKHPQLPGCNAPYAAGAPIHFQL